MVDIAPGLRALAARQDGLVTADQALAWGLTRHSVETLRRRREWRSVTYGVHLIDAHPHRHDPLPDTTRWRAALLAEGPASCLVGLTGGGAFGLHGIPVSARRIEVGLIGGPSRHRRHRPIGPVSRSSDELDIVVRQLVVKSDEVVSVNGLRVRDPFHTVTDAALQLPRPAALSVLDSALHLGLLTPQTLDLAVLAAGHRRGIVELRRLAALADGRAESMLESRVRLCCIDGGVPPDELQYAVRRAAGLLIAVGDLAWTLGRWRPLLAEADGVGIHSTPEAVFRDRRRGNALVGQACDTVRFLYADTLRPGYIANVVRTALRAA